MVGAGVKGAINMVKKGAGKAWGALKGGIGKVMAGAKGMMGKLKGNKQIRQYVVHNRPPYMHDLLLRDSYTNDCLIMPRDRGAIV